ncbi:DUF4920 domain-containing protein [[Flexibacter] sp. ATCC 35103]|uniref:DUF4920 domain-containing protein n=1 Tax=[Flexibacter] sp. ATCC 35103 TaxID=1937528 RepID=UPI0009C544AF|nr:DUF4920 domain-containing protein [[Flexibacter] sp. ATCC 35103]OMQ11095.1 DUF4920 domain-containing protein [[Flexibacter] sp. ATCC 35103]
MKLLIYFVILFFGISAQSFGQEDVEKKSPPVGNAVVGDYYGADVSSASENKAISIMELNDVLDKDKVVKNVSVKGVVTDVCKKRGCWITLKADNGSSVFVKMKEYAFFVPIALKGKSVVLEGDAEKEVTSVDELKHYAKDAKKAQAVIDAIVSPKEEIKFLASGIKVAN